MRKFITTSVFILIILFRINGQGCSDAGFCTLPSLKATNVLKPESINKNIISAGITYGLGAKGIKVLTPQFLYIRSFNESLMISTKITAQSQRGKLASTFGIGDIFFGAEYRLKNNLGFLTSIKLPLNDGNIVENNLPLPLDYQSSLGTFDIILGANYTTKSLGLAVGFQQPITQNHNAFLPELYPLDSDAQNYSPTNKYKRGGDILLRIAYKAKLFDDKVEIIPGILPIYHLKNDTYTDNMGMTNQLNGSEGLTLNGNLLIQYTTSTGNKTELSLAMPFISRDLRPDGLTREFVIGVLYAFGF